MRWPPHVRPVLVVHGIFDPAIRIAPLVRGLRARGLANVRRARVPALGTTPFDVLARVLAAHVARTKQELGCDRVDLVGFSMGALVARTYLQSLAGHEHVRTFVSISGPHRGTFMAYALPLRGIRQMRPGSAFLRALGDDVSGLEGVSVHCLYTPYDALILPAQSGILRGAKSVHRMDIRAHHLMLQDPRVHELVASLLRGEGDRAADDGLEGPSRTVA